MSTHNICFHGEIKKNINNFQIKLEICPQYMDAPALGYLTIKLQNSTWYKCLNLSLTGSRTYRRSYICMHIPMYGKPKNYMPPVSSDAGA